ncbi:MAG TPA: hypothetical protein VNH22_07795 [Blastocatellia bacterium]|nr:hypothetical protein [Blastocatellia bacterium]
MTTLSPFAAIGAKRTGFLRLIALAAAVLLCSNSLEAQQPAVGRKRVPRLTTDDIVRLKTEPVAEESTDAKPVEAGKAAAPAADAKATPEESAWRERVRAARERAKDMERAADEAELRITRLRNDLGVSGQSSRYRNETAAQLDEAGHRLTELRAAARKAASDLEELLQYGRQKGYKEEAPAQATLEGGKPNEEYYRTRYAALIEGLKDAERLVHLYENRVKDLNQRILLNTGSGDNFYTMQIQQDRDAMQEKLKEAQAAREEAQSGLDSLMEEARRAGLPPGIFR